MGCYDLTDKIGYTNDAISTNISKIKGIKKIYKNILKDLMKIDVNEKNIDEETETYDQIKGDSGA